MKTLLNRRTISWIIISGSTVLFIAILLIAIYMVSLSGEIDQRFSSRPWDIPSRVYSDTTLLYTGQKINFDLLVKKLVRLGYRNTDHAPEKQGEMSASKKSIAIYLHDFNTPT